LKKGFVREDRKDRLYILMFDGRKSRISTILSHTSNMDYGDNLLNLVAGQMKLSKRELLQFVECTMSGSKYEDLMVDRGWVTKK
jgi:hypothetical protein